MLLHLSQLFPIDFAHKVMEELQLVYQLRKFYHVTLNEISDVKEDQFRELWIMEKEMDMLLNQMPLTVENGTVNVLVFLPLKDTLSVNIVLQARKKESREKF